MNSSKSQQIIISPGVEFHWTTTMNEMEEPGASDEFCSWRASFIEERISEDF